MNKFFVALLLASSFAFGQSAPASDSVRVDSNLFSGLGARNIGPGTMSGRVAAIDGVIVKDRLTLYVGAAGGGVWKSENGGTTFKPVFDKYTQSIGAVTIDPNDPKTVWVGTGESWARNSVSVGTGIYKTTDGGDTWQFMGLPKSEHIARILVDSKNSNTVYACAMGHLWDRSEQRGVYKTLDGGKSWNKILTVNDDTGCAMLAMDPQNSGTLYAAMWQFRRKAWTFNSGGPGSALFKTTDGGSTWKKLTKGLPEGELGRIAVAVAPSKPNVVYAAVEAKDGALFRSDDGGDTWNRLSSTLFMVWRPFYFANLYVDPKNENRVYKVGGSLIESEDGGKTFNAIAGSIHGDFHTIWINPNDPERMIVGDDGGLGATEDRGAHWRFFANLPVGQFYHVSYDMERPYNVYGGLQDNSSWFGPNTWPGGTTNSMWVNVFGGDGFWVFEDPSDPNYIYAEAQGGYIGRVNRHTHETRDIQPTPGANEKKYRFNWNTPIHMSPNEKGTIYIGAEYLFRSRDHGNSWEKISPDLTTNDPEKQKQEESGGITVDNSAAEENTTIYTISESPKDGKLIWVGTDDGNVQITRDGGKSWTNVIKNVPSLPPNTWVTTVEASRYDAGTAYATFDNHYVGDIKTYAYKTTDYGQTWQPLISDDSGVTGWAHVIKEDTVNKNLLFMGTEWGLYISIDGGKQWAKFRGKEFPENVAVNDIAVQPREGDLLLATHGRGMWVLDDLTPLRELTPETLQKDVAFLDSRPAVQSVLQGYGWADGEMNYVGRATADGAFITYYQKRRHIFGDLKLEVYDSSGKLVSKLPASTRKGINRVEWSERIKAPRVPPAATAAFAASQGPRLVPGTYTVKLLDNGKTYTSQVKVTGDPLSKATPEDRQLQFDTSMKIYATLERMSDLVDSMLSTHAQVQQAAAKLPEADATRKRLDALADSIDTLRSKIVATKEGGAVTGEERIRELTAELYGNVAFYEGRPTQTQINRASALDTELSAVVNDYDALMKTELPAVNQMLQKKKLPAIKVPPSGESKSGALK